MRPCIHQHKTLGKLLILRKNAVLTDFDIIFGDQSFSCHKAIAVLASRAIDSLVESNVDYLVVPEDTVTTTEVITSVINTFYGAEIEVAGATAYEVAEFARLIDSSPLVNVSRTTIKQLKPQTFSPSFTSILSELQNDQHRDFSLVYKNVRINIHKFLLATLCPVFLSRFELQPGDNEWNFTDLLTVQESSFKEFFTSFYKDNITITLDNLFDISHLSFYFQMSSLESCCDSLMNSAEPLVSWIFPALESADKADDLRFVDRLASVLVKVDGLAQSDPVAIKPDVLYKLCPNVNVFWLSTVLVHSYFHYDANNNQRVWTPNEVEKAPNQIDTNTLTIEQLYSIIKPLLEAEELYSVLSEFSLTRFTTEKSEIPSEWLLWLMVELDKNEPTNELNMTARFASLLSKVFSKAKLSLIEPFVLHPKSFNVYLSTITKQYLILWFIRSLIISWKVENHWTVQIFDEILSNVNLENVDSRELIAVLRHLESVAELFDFYCKFMSLKVTPLVIRDYAKTSEELSTSKQELRSVERNLKVQIESFNKSKAEDEHEKEMERRRREELELENNSNKTTINNLQSEISKIQTILDVFATKEHQQRERQRLEEEERQRLLASYRSNPLSFIANNPNSFFNVCGGKVKFLSETRGHKVQLSNADLRADMTGGYLDNSFIAISRPPTGKVVLTSNKVSDSFIGVFDPSQAQGEEPWKHMNGIRVRTDCFFVKLRGSNIDKRKTSITRVEVEFTQSNFKITLPQANWSRDYDYEEGWVFGLFMWDNGQSWSIVEN
ncbi:hypothetical protein RCL1_004197 [Eukaryota sp. TZLM3-RCL]